MPVSRYPSSMLAHIGVIDKIITQAAINPRFYRLRMRQLPGCCTWNRSPKFQLPYDCDISSNAHEFDCASFHHAELAFGVDMLHYRKWRCWIVCVQYIFECQSGETVGSTNSDPVPVNNVPKGLLVSYLQIRPQNSPIRNQRNRIADQGTGSTARRHVPVKEETEGQRPNSLSSHRPAKASALVMSRETSLEEPPADTEVNRGTCEHICTKQPYRSSGTQAGTLRLLHHIAYHGFDNAFPLGSSWAYRATE